MIREPQPLSPDVCAAPAAPGTGAAEAKREGRGFELLERMRAEAPEGGATCRFLATIDAWLHASARGNAPSLEQYLGMPTTSARRRRYLRDAAVREASAHVDAPRGSWAAAVAVASEWEVFVVRGGWDAAARSPEPPDEIRSQLRRALWAASWLNGGETLSADQVDRILRRTD